MGHHSWDIGKGFEELLTRGLSRDAAGGLADRFDALDQRFADDFSTWPQILYWVPGRLEILGKHVDYAGGRSLTAALEKGFCFAAAPRSDSLMRITAADSLRTCTFEISPRLQLDPASWTLYPIAVARRLARDFAGRLRGADVLFASDLPQNAGLSSSSALVSGIFLILDVVNRLRQDPSVGDLQSRQRLAEYLSCVESGRAFGESCGDQGVGTQGGSQDHVALLCSRAGRLGCYSHRPCRLEASCPSPVDHAWCLAVSGVQAPKTREALASYNNLSRQTRDILDLWRRKTEQERRHLEALLQADPDAEAQMRTWLSEASPSNRRSLLERLRQFRAESREIVPQATRALAQGDWSEFGRLSRRSQEMAEDVLKNQVPQTRTLVRTARQFGAVAASAFGAGFGGSVWALVERTQVDAFLDQWRQSYRREFPGMTSASAFFVSQAGPAAFRIGGDKTEW